MKPGMATRFHSFQADIRSQARQAIWPHVVMAAFLIGAPALLPSTACAQDASNEGGEVVISILNGTTQEPASAEKLIILPETATHRPVAEDFEVSGEVNLGALVLEPSQSYIIEVISDGVSYFARASGRELQSQITPVYIFTTTSALTGVKASGMNLVIRRAETELEIEYLLTVVNESLPQQTVVGDPTSLELALPADVQLGEIEVMRGHTPQAITASSGSNPGWTGLAVPLPPGTTRLRLVASIPYPEQLVLRVGFNIPVEAWSVLTSPVDLDIRGTDLVPVDAPAESNLRRHTGPALSAGETVLLTLGGGSGPVITGVEVSTATPEDLARAADDSRGGGGLLKYWWALILVAIAIFIVLRRSKP